MSHRYIFVSGGVISGIGKGVTAASIGFLLETYGYRVVPLKCDAYVNIDAGTIRPQEHGEVFVTEDGMETDQDLGHYERFLHQNLTRLSYLTTGQIYQSIIKKERNFEYGGEDVEVVPHVPEEIIRRIDEVGHKHKADFVIVEIGGTVGEYQNVLFLEANRILKFREKAPVVHIHVAYLPTPKHLGEMKSKPVQTSVRLLNETMIQPDFIVGRAVKSLDKPRIDRLSMFCNTDRKDIISSPYVDSIYEVPLVFRQQKFGQKILKKFGLKKKPKALLDFKKWENIVTKSKKNGKKVKIGIVGKYQKTGDYILPDSYVCVLESITHACWHLGVSPEIVWIDSEQNENNPKQAKVLGKVDALVVPQGWGSRGVEGKIKAIKYARENKVPYLGLCFGMQMAVIEFARNVLGLSKANSEEVNPKSNDLVIHIMPKQREYLKNKQYGGTIRLGAWPCVLNKKSLLYDLYCDLPDISLLLRKRNPFTVMERHRHRYEFNNKYKSKFEKAGMVFSGMSPDKKLVEAIELPKDIHPFFVGVQFHPEYKSRLLFPHPIFLGLIKACIC